MSSSKLVDGRIPAGTKCPFKGECEYYKAGECGHFGKDHTVAYSCGVARLYDVTNIYASRFESKQAGE